MPPPPPVLRGPRELSYGGASFFGQQNDPFESDAPTVLGEPPVRVSGGGAERAGRSGTWGRERLMQAALVHTHTHTHTHTQTQLAPLSRRAASTNLEFSIQPALFRGLQLDAQTGVISGLPRVQVWQRDRETERQSDRETERQRDRETERLRDRETERQRDRETEG